MDDRLQRNFSQSADNALRTILGSMSSKTLSAVSTPGLAGMQERLIVALDVSTAQAARELVRRIGDAAGVYKVGLQLFTAEGPDLVRELVASGRKVFLDLK